MLQFHNIFFARLFHKWRHVTCALWRHLSSLPHQFSIGSLSNDDADGNDNRPKAIGLINKNNNFARGKCLNSRFVEAGNTRQQLSVLFLNFDTVLKNSTPKTIANIWRIKRDGISVIKFEAVRIHFLSDVFVAVAVAVA